MLDNLIKAVNSNWCLEANSLNTLLEVFDKKLNNDMQSLVAFDMNLDENMKSQFGEELLNGGKTAYVKVSGTLVPRTASLKPYCGMTPTYGIMSLLKEAESNPRIENFILHLDTGGGALVGVPELAKALNESRLNTISFTDTKALSGGMWLWSACKDRVATESANLGSIGVYRAITKRKEESAYTKTIYISAGEKKLYGASDIALTEKEQAYFQSTVDADYNWFTSEVARYTGVSVEEVRGTEAEVFYAKDKPQYVSTFSDLSNLLNFLEEKK